MQDVLMGWPFLTLVVAPLLMAWVVRSADRDPLEDPTTLLRLLLPLYMLHQFEEHGVDLFGRRYAFQADFCATLGFHDVTACPGDASFILAANVGGVWLAGALTFGLARRPALASCFLGLPFVNALAHVGAALVGGRYNPGLASALLLLLPHSVWTTRVLVRSGAIPLRALPLVVLGGVLLHAVLVGAIQLQVHGVLPADLVRVLQVANGLVPLVPGLWTERLTHPR